MEEILDIKEQPDMSCPVNVATASEECSNDVGQSGSLYGKFKDADSLFNGYKELEKVPFRQSGTIGIMPVAAGIGTDLQSLKIAENSRI